MIHLTKAMLPRSAPAFLQASSKMLQRLVADFRAGVGRRPRLPLPLRRGRRPLLRAGSRWAFPEESLLDSTADMQAQLGRYRADVAQGKVPDELTVPQYGANVWLTVHAGRALVARKRRHRDRQHVRAPATTSRSTVGLPLLAGGRS